MKKRQYTTRKLVVTLPLICGTEEKLLCRFLERLPEDIAITRHGTEVCLPFDECAELLGFDETDDDELAGDAISKTLQKINGEFVRIDGYGHHTAFSITTDAGIMDDVYLIFNTTSAASVACLQHLKQEEELKNAE